MPRTIESRREAMLENWKQYTLRTCIKKTAQTFQRMIRLESADENGIIHCVTCDNWQAAIDTTYKGSMHAGHFVGSRCNSILFDERNVHPQCGRCNTYLHGNQEQYTSFMLERYGQDVIDDLNELRSSTRQFTKEELVDMRIAYMDRIKVAEKRIREL